jgi:hypothetical protein
MSSFSTAGQGEPMTPLQTLAIADWQGPFPGAVLESAGSALELGQILYFPRLCYTLENDAAAMLSPCLADSRAKNISYDAPRGALKGTAATTAERPVLQNLMSAFSAAATRFVSDLFPHYVGRIEPARASFRPVEVAGRDYSPLRDDRLLHIDAFPSTPMRGRRILRLFCNIDPNGKPRVWHVGEPFAEFAQNFVPSLHRRGMAAAWLLAAIGLTRGRRSAYDQLMLGLHDRAKRDTVYQESAPQREIIFPAGSSWLCFTDEVLHAAISGQYALEQTFYLDVEAMADPSRSPLRTLERLTGRRLA